MNQILPRLKQVRTGIISEQEFYDLLNDMQIRGILHGDCMNKTHFIGYDYLNQKWIDTSKSILA